MSEFVAILVAILFLLAVLGLPAYLIYRLIIYIFPPKKKNSLSLEKRNEMREKILQGDYSTLWQTKLILKSDEFVIFCIPFVPLSEERFADVKGRSSLVSVDVAGGVSVGLGGVKASSEKKITEIDKGELTVTNRRLHYDGRANFYDYNLDEIVSVEVTSSEEYFQTSQGIVIGRMGKTKKEYFSIVADVSITLEPEKSADKRSAKRQTIYRFTAEECNELLRQAIVRYSHLSE